MASVVQDRLVEVELVEAPVAQRAPVAEGKAFRAYDPDQVLLMAPVVAGLGAGGASRAVRVRSGR